MIVELMPAALGSGAPLRVEASQVVVYNSQGTPIMVAGEYGPSGAQKVAHAGDDDFQQTLKAFGVGRFEVVTEHISLAPVPAGAVLLSQPQKESGT
jgi:hypothetical protein